MNLLQWLFSAVKNTKLEKTVKKMCKERTGI